MCCIVAPKKGIKVFMIVIFFYFISGWQALNLRNAVYQHLQDISQPGYILNNHVHKVSLIGENNIIFLPGYQPRQIIFDLPERLGLFPNGNPYQRNTVCRGNCLYEGVSYATSGQVERQSRSREHQGL